MKPVRSSAPHKPGIVTHRYRQSTERRMWRDLEVRMIFDYIAS